MQIETILVFVIYLLLEADSFTIITDYVNTSSFSNMNYNYAFQVNNGQEAYIGVQQNGMQIIKKYNLTGGVATLQGSYIVSGTNANGILMYKDYLIVYYQYSTTLAIMNKTSYAQLGTFSLGGLNIISLVYLQTTNIVLYASSSGVFGYITDFLNTNVMITIVSSLSGTLTLQTSPNQNYATVLAGNTKQILIYSMTNYLLVANLTMGFYSWTNSFSACWHSDSTKLYVAPLFQGVFYIVDFSNSYAMSNQTFAAQNSMTVYQMVYSPIQNALVFANYYNSLNNVTIFTFSTTNSTILKQQDFYYSDMITGLQFDFQQQMFFAAWSVNLVFFYSFNLCNLCNENQTIANFSLNSSNNTNSSNVTNNANSSTSNISNISNSSNLSQDTNNTNSSNLTNYSNSSIISNSSNFTNTSNISSNNSYNSSNSSYFSNFSNFSNLTNSSLNSNLTSNISTSQNQTNNNPIQKVSFMKAYLENTMTVIGYATMIMQCTPLVNYFLRFINFWSISSMYILLNINFYIYFYQIMIQFYQIANISIFEVLNLDFPWLQFGQNKVQGKYYNQFQLSTKFMDNLQQPFIMIISCAISIYLYNKLVKFICSQKNYKKLKLDFYIAIQSSFVSQMNNFILPLSILFTTFYQNSFYEQINLILYTFFVFSCVLSPFVILLLNGQKVKKNTFIPIKSIHFLRPTNLKYKSIISHPYFDLFYVSLINIFIPGLVTLEQPLWFIFIGGGLHLVRIWVDYRRKQFTINGVLLSIEMLLFHISFSMLYFDFKLEINEFIILFTLGILILGGLHQILTLFFGIFYQIYRFFKSNKVQEQPQSKQAQMISTKEKIRQKFKIKNVNRKIKFTTTKREIQTDLSNSIKFQPKMKKIIVQKTQYRLKYSTHFLNVQQSKKSQDQFQSEIESFDFYNRTKKSIKSIKFSKKQSQ